MESVGLTGSYRPVELTKDIQDLFTWNLPGINAHLHGNWATVFVNSVYEQIVNGWRYRGKVTGGNGKKATVVIYKPRPGSENEIPTVVSAVEGWDE